MNNPLEEAIDKQIVEDGIDEEIARAQAAAKKLNLTEFANKLRTFGKEHGVSLFCTVLNDAEDRGLNVLQLNDDLREKDEVGLLVLLGAFVSLYTGKYITDREVNELMNRATLRKLLAERPSEKSEEVKS